MTAKPVFTAEIETMIGVLHVRASISLPVGVTALIGSSGAGKTTIADIIAGLRMSDFGHMRLKGRILADEVSTRPLPPNARKIGYVFQDIRLFPHLSVEKNLRYGMKTDNSEWHDILAMLGLTALLDRKPGSLSGGEARRVAIGRALLTAPELLILDEPLTGLDPARKERLYPYLEKVCHSLKMPVLFISHQVDDVIRLADYVQFIENGRTVPALPLEEAFSSPAMQRFMGKQDSGAILTARVEERQEGLTRLNFPGGDLLTVEALALDQQIRLRIQARDISLAREKPKDISVLNILPARIASLRELGDEVDVSLVIENDQGESSDLIARISRYSAKNMDLQPGEKIFALIKAVAVTRKLFRE